MGKRLYTDVAAARHMSSGTRKVDPGEPSVRLAGTVKPERASSYRKKRAVAIALSTVVAVSVPTLVTLLVLFG